MTKAIWSINWEQNRCHTPLFSQWFMCKSAMLYLQVTKFHMGTTAKCNQVEDTSEDDDPYEKKLPCYRSATD